jgi:hypothetical protein
MIRTIATAIAVASLSSLAACSSSPEAPAPAPVKKEMRINKPASGVTAYGGSCSCQYYSCAEKRSPSDPDDCWWGDSWPCDCETGNPSQNAEQSAD